jgi:hypothetical protein
MIIRSVEYAACEIYTENDHRPDLVHPRFPWRFLHSVATVEVDDRSYCWQVPVVPQTIPQRLWRTEQASGYMRGQTALALAREDAA